MRDVLLVGICAVLSGCVSPIVVPDLQERLVGYWDWSIRDEVCFAETAHNITFSPDGTRIPAYALAEVTEDLFFTGGALCRASAAELGRRLESVALGETEPSTEEEKEK